MTRRKQCDCGAVFVGGPQQDRCDDCRKQRRLLAWRERQRKQRLSPYQRRDRRVRRSGKPAGYDSKLHILRLLLGRESL